MIRNHTYLNPLPRLLAAAVVLCLASIHANADTEEEQRRFYVYNASNGLADNSAQTIDCTKTGRLVISAGWQLNFYDGQKFSYIDPSAKGVYPLSKYEGHSHLYFDKHHHIWLKRKHGLTCVNLMKEVFVEDVAGELEKFGFEGEVHDLFVDSQNEVWLLTAKGLFCCKDQRTFKVDSRLSLHELDVYQDKYLLLFYDNGQVNVLELSTGSVVFTEKAYGKNKTDKYRSTSLVRSVGNTFYQIRNGKDAGILLRFDIGKWEWKTILETPYYLSNIVEHDSTLYIPSAQGYWTYRLSDGQLHHVERLQMATGQMLLTDINAMEFDLQGGLWVGTEKRGLLYARPFGAPFRAYGAADPKAEELSRLMEALPPTPTEYRGERVNCVFRDSRGWDWVGTSTGVYIYKGKDDTSPMLVSRKEGLLNNVVHVIAEDQFQHVWVGSSYGICCIFIENGKVRYVNRYNQWDGVPNEMFVNGKALSLPDGTMAFQTIDHIVTFSPGQMHTITGAGLAKIYPKLVRIFVNGTDINAGDKLDGKVILQQAVTRTKELNLNYDQNTVSLTFSGLNYFRPQQTYYRVRVTGPGMDGQWRVYAPYDAQGLVDRGGLLHLPLASLHPGSYKVELQASMMPDEWESRAFEWTININEPWWRTTGVFALVILVLLVMLTVYVVLYLKNANLKAMRNNQEQGIVRRICAFAEHCDVGSGLLLEPSVEEVSGSALSGVDECSPEFLQLMTAIVPVVLSKRKADRISMRELCVASGKSPQEFYALVTSNIYKNPHPVAMQMMLSRAAELLTADKEKDIAEIAAACGFATPNYFIAAFFHKFKKTPAEFRMEDSGS